MLEGVSEREVYGLAAWSCRFLRKWPDLLEEAVGGQAPCKWSEVCGHGFKMKPLTGLRFSRVLVLGSAV